MRNIFQKYPTLRVGLVCATVAFILTFAVGVYAQSAPPTSVPLSGPAKAVAVAVAVVALVQAVKAALNSLVPNFVKGRVALIFTAVAAVGATLATFGTADVTWTQLALSVFSSSGLFAAIQAIIKGQPSA